jgi:sugar lactone lactonase YvrE
MMRTLGFALAAASLAFTSCGDEPDVDCDAPGVACTWAGIGGEEGFTEDGAHRLDMRFSMTMDMTFQADGTPWLIDWNYHRVMRVDPDGTLHTFVGWLNGLAGDGDDGFIEITGQEVLGTHVRLNHPTDLAALSDGTILVMSWHNHKLRKLDPTTGMVRILSGKDPGFAGDGTPAMNGRFRQPRALEVAPDGTMYILDQQNFRIRKIDTDGIITTIAGNGMRMYAGDGGPALECSFDFEAGSNPEPSGGLALDGDKLYVADTLSNRIRVIDLGTGMIANYAGTGVEGYSGDGGAALDAQFSKPRGMEIGPDGHLYIADTDNNVIRAIDPATGTIRTVAGTGMLAFDPADEGKPATEMDLKRPFGLEFDHDGNLYIMDTINHRIVRVAK